MEPISLLLCHFCWAERKVYHLWRTWRTVENKSLPLFPTLYRCGLHTLIWFSLSYSPADHQCLYISSRCSSPMTHALKNNHEKWVMLLCCMCQFISHLFGLWFSLAAGVISSLLYPLHSCLKKQKPPILLRHPPHGTAWPQKSRFIFLRQKERRGSCRNK